MANPWLDIPAEDYDAHMQADGVEQAQALDRVFGELYAELRPSRLAVLGCGTGTGLRHVDAAVTRRVIAVDVNAAYLELARARAPHLARCMALVTAPVEECALAPGAFDQIHAALLFEYADPARVLPRIATWLAPGGALTVVLQEPGGDDGPVAATTVASVRTLADVMTIVPAERFRTLAEGHGFVERRGQELPLPRGKRFYVGVFTAR